MDKNLYNNEIEDTLQNIISYRVTFYFYNLSKFSDLDNIKNKIVRTFSTILDFKNVIQEQLNLQKFDKKHYIIINFNTNHDYFNTKQIISSKKDIIEKYNNEKFINICYLNLMEKSEIISLFSNIYFPSVNEKQIKNILNILFKDIKNKYCTKKNSHIIKLYYNLNNKDNSTILKIKLRVNVSAYKEILLDFVKNKKIDINFEINFEIVKNIFEIKIEENIFIFNHFINICKKCKLVHELPWNNQYKTQFCSFVCDKCSKTYSEKKAFENHDCKAVNVCIQCKRLNKNEDEDSEVDLDHRHNTEYCPIYQNLVIDYCKLLFKHYYEEDKFIIEEKDFPSLKSYADAFNDKNEKKSNNLNKGINIKMSEKDQDQSRASTSSLEENSEEEFKNKKKDLKLKKKEFDIATDIKSEFKRQNVTIIEDGPKCTFSLFINNTNIMFIYDKNTNKTETIC